MASRTFTPRYSLDVQINSKHNALLWRAIDQSLDRVVCIVLLPHNDPRASTLLKLATAAAVNSSRGAVSILDVVENSFVTGIKTIDSELPYLGIVTEWVEGQTIDHIIGKNNEPFDIKQALKILTHVTSAVGAMHALGVTHGRLRPRNIYLNEAGEVRVSGFGIDRALFQADGDTMESDIAGIGDLLFAMVSATWPHGSVGALVGAEILADHALTLPSQMHNRIPEAIDELYRKTQDGSLKNTDELLQAISIARATGVPDLRGAVTRWTEHEVLWHGKDIPKTHRLRYSIFAFIGIYVFGWIGWQLMTTNFHSSTAAPTSLHTTLPTPTSSPTATASATASASPSVSGSGSPSPSASWATALAQPVAVIDFDPFGDGAENPEQAKMAIDGDLTTTWTTNNYYRNDFGKKPGVGLVIDLGRPEKVKAVNVTFAGAGHSGTVFISNDAKPDISTATVLATVSNSDVAQTFSTGAAISGRYVLVWLTKIPRISNGNFVGGIAEVTIGL